MPSPLRLGAIILTTPHAHRNGRCFIGRPPQPLHPVVKNSWANAVCFSGIYQRIYSALVPILLFSVGPNAISGRVRRVVINSLDRMSRRARAHISEKGGGIVEPRITHCNASTAIISITRIVRIIATTLGGIIRLEFTGYCSPLSRPMPPCDLGDCLPAKAAARLRFKSNKLGPFYSLFGAAIADTPPHSAAPFPEMTDGGEAPKALARNIMKCRHSRNL